MGPLNSVSKPDRNSVTISYPRWSILYHKGWFDFQVFFCRRAGTASMRRTACVPKETMESDFSRTYHAKLRVTMKF